jgi:DNA-binding SARP family transcriptional activator
MLRLRTFGGLTLERDGIQCTGAATQRRRLALLALLAAGPDAGTSRDRIATLLWPDADPARSRHSLDDALSALRRDLGGSLFVGVATLRPNPELLTSDVAERSDALRRGELERAVALHTGPFLDGFAVPGADEFDRWVDQERRSHLTEQGRAIDSLASAAAARGDAEAAIRWRSARVALDPLDTAATLRLLTAHAAAGHHVEVLRLARVHETLVRTDLNMTPGVEWTAALERLRQSAAVQAAAVKPESVVQVAHAAPTAAIQQSDRTEPSPEIVPIKVAHAVPALRSGKWRSRSLLIVGSAAVVIVAIVTATITWSHSRSSAAGRSEPWRVLVVPFQNATNDSALAPLGRMASDWVAQGLAGIEGITVTTDPSLSPTAGRPELERAAIRQDAGSVVSGSYYADGDSIKLQARITDVAGWTLRPGLAPVTAPRALPTALLAPLQQRVMVVLAAAHDPRYAAFTGGALPPTYEAYDQYLAGTAIFEQGRWSDALPYYSRAAALDSSYVQPLLGAVDAELNLGEPAVADTLVRRLELRRSSLSAADQGSVDRLRGVINGDAMAALAGARASESAAPGAQLPRYLHSLTALRAGRPGEALEAAAPIASSFGRVRTPWAGGIYWSVVTAAHHMRGEYAAERAAAGTARKYHDDNPDIRAMELRAFAALGQIDSLRTGLAELEVMPSTLGAASTPSLLILLAQELDAHGHPGDARAVLRQAIAAATALPSAAQRTTAARFERARALYLLGEYDTAVPIVAALESERPNDPRYLVFRGLIAARSGDTTEANQVADRLVKLKIPYDRGQISFARARLAAVLGHRGDALTLLRRALAEGLDYGVTLHADADFSALRADPGFQTIIAPSG